MDVQGFLRFFLSKLVSSNFFVTASQNSEYLSYPWNLFLAFCRADFGVRGLLLFLAVKNVV